ncbi:MAG TPA: sulfur oxidation c-type cytochrome SoxX [Geminicoccus sp.]|uniref:sulfur oxidation c-type cytochrome SoxX n=1 Tax=Geminicoccus sp. TaxID=2024832 RepID=UPI002CFF21D8|nr:sulfur oxidation c-type cytochrome SoxX [Geminicoccus sp.]HWL68169.1 sulfur oxidation c-type cytochrome SoxX [Geminicoccus sp.]
MKPAGVGAAILALAALPADAEEAPVPYRIVGDAIPAPLTGGPGDPARGAALIGERHKSLCVLCHAGPWPDPHLQGTLGPDLSGVGARLDAGQIRLRIVDPKHLDPGTIMPAYYRQPDPGQNVAEAFAGRTILSAAEIEDLVAHLASLKD